MLVGVLHVVFDFALLNNTKCTHAVVLTKLYQPLFSRIACFGPLLGHYWFVLMKEFWHIMNLEPWYRRLRILTRKCFRVFWSSKTLSHNGTLKLLSWRLEKGVFMAPFLTNTWFQCIKEVAFSMCLILHHVINLTIIVCINKVWHWVNWFFVFDVLLHPVLFSANFSLHGLFWINPSAAQGTWSLHCFNCIAMTIRRWVW